MKKPNHVSQTAWDRARHLASKAFTIPINDQVDYVINLAEKLTEEENKVLSAEHERILNWNRFVDNMSGTIGSLY